MRSINQAGLDLIKSFESFRAEPYRDEDGIWTIGYGHTRQVTGDSQAVAEEQAEALLRQDILVAEVSVCGLITAALNENQYAALVSLVYNAGPAPLTRMLGIRLNKQDYRGAADEFLRWRLAGGMVSDGLVRRRQAERALFLTPEGDS
jgi:lysozyme